MKKPKIMVGHAMLLLCKSNSLPLIDIGTGCSSVEGHHDFFISMEEMLLKLGIRKLYKVER